MSNESLMLKSLNYIVGNKYIINKSEMMYFGNYKNSHLLFGDILLQTSLMYSSSKFYFNHILKFRNVRTGKIPTFPELTFIANQIEKFDLQLSSNNSALSIVAQPFFHVDNLYYQPLSRKHNTLAHNIFLLAVHREN